MFQPQAAPLAALARRIKNAFDPEDILNSGKMGITGRGA
ncbi:MAG: FAD-linked oxidase C-terminal domain-containing protein [Candidatus Puniceispirillaceae bacterium]